MNDCLFCKIVSGQIPAFKICEDDKYLAFLDISRFTEGHTLVIPKKHYSFIWDMEDVREFYAFSARVANHFRKLGCTFVDSASFGRRVPHAHYHLIPHSKDASDWEKALFAITELQTEVTRRLTKEQGTLVQQKFSMVTGQ
jgi:histidine triad (HIT) family protein